MTGCVPSQALLASQVSHDVRDVVIVGWGGEHNVPRREGHSDKVSAIFVYQAGLNFSRLILRAQAKIEARSLVGPAWGARAGGNSQLVIALASTMIAIG